MRNLTVLTFLAASICGTAFAQSNTTATLAGGGPVGGSLATAASLNLPQGVAVDANGNVYVALAGAHQVFVADSNGKVLGVFGTGIRGYSGDGGRAVNAQLNFPYGVAVDSSGNIYIAEYGNNVIRKITFATGLISTVAGNFAAGYGFSGDGGAATSATLNAPVSVAVDSVGNLYIGDFSNNAIRKVTASTGFISTFAGSSLGTAGYSGDGGPATGALLRTPNGVAVDAGDNVYVSEQTNQVVRKITASTGIISPVAGNAAAGSGYAGDGGAATGAKLFFPANIAIDAGGNLFIADQSNNIVRKVTASTGLIGTVAGTPSSSGYSGESGPATSAQLNSNHGVAVDASGNLYIADSGNRRIRKVTASTGVITTYAGNGFLSFSGDGGTASAAQLFAPNGVAIDASGNIYIADTSNNLIRKIAAGTGLITTVAGNPALLSGYSGDSGPATSAQLAAPRAVAVDSNGNIYISDSGNQRIRRVTALTGVVTTIAGTGIAGFFGDGEAATSATINQPWQIAVDSGGNVYFAEVGNHIIRKITASTGFISTFAGSNVAGYSGDGTIALRAQLRNPYGVALDSAGNVYIADTGNNVIRKVSVSTGFISTIAGSATGSAGYTGDGAAATGATLNLPEGVAVDAGGNVFIADTSNYAIRRVAISNGFISTLAGTGTSGFTPDGGISTSGQLTIPYSLALGATDGSRVIVVDPQANRVRQIAIPSAQTITFTNPGSKTFGSGSVSLAASSGAVGANIVFGSLTPLVCGVSGSSTTLLALGTCTITAFAPAFGSFSGGNSLQASTRQSFAISAAAQSVSFTSVPASVIYGVPSFSVTAASTAPGATVVVGSSTPAICTVSGTSVTVLSVGTCVLTGDSAAFSGYNAATQVTQNVVVNPAAQVLTFNAPPATVTLGSGNVSLTAASNAPGASIVFASTTANACSVSGSSVTLLAVGTCTITANAAAVGNHSVAGQVSRSFSIVAPAQTTTVLTATPNPVTFGANLTLTATVTPAAATGSVLFQDGATVIGNGSLLNGAVSYVIAGLSTGAHTMTAVYSGDSLNAGSTSAAISLTINPAPSISSVANSLDGSAGPLAPGSLASIVGSNLAGAAATGTAPLGTSLGGVSVTLNGGVVPISQVSPGGIDFQVPYGTVPGSYPLVVQNSVKSNTFVVTIVATAPYVNQQILNAGSTPNNVDSPALPGTVVTALLTGIGKVTPGIADGISAAGVYTPVAVFSATINGLAIANPQLTLFQGGTPGFAKASVTVPTTLAVGTYPLVVTVGGVASPAQSVAVGAGSATALTSSLNPSIVGQSVTLTATVSPSTASGTVTFFDGVGPSSTTIGTATVTGGVATLTTSALTVGTHSITAVYAGDGFNGGSTSAVVNQVVNSTITSSPTTTLLASSANPSNIGQSITLTANVSSNTATGLMTFFDGTTQLGTGAVSVGAATFSTGSLGIGSHSLTAVYAGDVNFGSSTSSALAQTVRPLATNTSLVSSANPVAFGGNVTFTASVTPSTATGTITFNDGTGKLGTVTIANGTATFSSAALSIGTHSLTASYSGDTNNAAANSAAISQVVNASTTTTTIASSANPGTFGQSITLTATVKPATATGTITFNDGTTKLGTATIANGTAAFSSASLTVGTHSIAAVYGGDANNAAGASSAFSQVVNAAITTTTLTSSANPSTFAQSITLTANVSPAVATGTVTFNDGTTKLGTATIANGSATFSSAALTVGTHSIAAVYSGDTNNAVSTSSAVGQVVNAATTTTTIASSANPATLGQNVVFTATVSPVTATGTVRFYDGTVAPVAPVAPVNPITASAKATFRTRALNDLPVALGTATLINGKASFGTNALSSGTHALIAVYSGDTNNAASTSSALTQTVNQAATTTTSLVSSANPSAFAQNITLTATVLQATATGTITFVDGTTPLGTATVANGAASFSTAGLATGSHSITAVYGGDANNAGSSSAILIQSVGLVSSTISLTASPNPATAGGAITLTASLTPSNSTGTVTFKDGASPLGTANIAGGVATLSGFNLSFGNHNLTAVYSGDANHGGATSAAVAVSSIFPPISIVSSGLPPGQVGQPYGPVGLSATGGSSSFRWSASGLPDGLGISTSGSISGTPTAAFTGSVSFTVTDQISNNLAVAAFSLSITTSPLTLSGPANLGSFLSSAPISAAFTPTGGTTPYTFTVSGPAGLSVSSAGQLSGSVASPANYNVTVTVIDSKGLSSTKTVGLSVFGITTTSLAPGTTATAYSGSINAAGGAAPYTVTATGLPAGIALSGNTLSGRATVAGSYPVGVKVSEAGGLSATASYTLNITGPGPLKLVSTAVSDATVGTPYSDSVSATGGSTSYTWSQSGGILPAGLTFDAAGALTGQPSTPGTYALGVLVTDALGAKAVGGIAINVKPSPLLFSNDGSLPSGIVGIEYPYQILAASGGIGPYTFGVKGALPAGLALSGYTLSGTPTQSGDSSFSFTVADSSKPALTGLLGVTATIRPASPDIVLAASSASFAITSGTSAPPSPTAIGVSSSVVPQNIAFSTAVSAPWISVTGAAGTPGVLSVGLNATALSLGAAGSPYKGAVTVTCTSPACAGKVQTISVNLAVSSPPAQLSLGNTLLSFAALSGNPRSSTAALPVTNAGGGILAVTSVEADATWLTVSSFPSALQPGPGGNINLTADPAGLTAGYYRANIKVVSSGGSASAVATLFISSASTMSLSPSGAQFTLPQGGVLGQPSGSFNVVALASGSIPYTASVVSGGTWISVSGGSGTASSAGAGTVNYSVNPSAVAALPTGAYYAAIRVSGTGVVNSPQDYQVILNVTPANTPVIPDPQAAGLVLISDGTGTAPASQTITVYASSKTAIPYTASATTDDGGTWLSIAPSTGSSSASAPGLVIVTANPTGLKQGAYRGQIGFAFGTSVRAVNVTLIVQPAAAPKLTSALDARRSQTAAGPICANAVMVPTQTGLVSNFSQPASWPTPLTIKLFDSCGSTVTGAQIVATFTNGDPPLALTQTGAATGVYSATWTPRKASSQVTVTAAANAAGYPGASVKIAGQVAPNTAPVLVPNAAGDVFNPQVGAGLGPGNIIQIYGSGLASQIAAPATLPLPTQLSGTSVIIGGIESPLFYVSPGQVNAQIPFELAPGQQIQLIVNANGALTAPQSIQLNGGTPSILSFASGATVAQHLDGTLILDSSPAVPGEYVVIYTSGMGATDIPVPSGTASPSNPVARVATPPILTLGGVNVPVAFAGLTPGFAGLYQVNFQLPTDIKTGNYELLLTQSDTVGNKSVLTVVAPAQ